MSEWKQCPRCQCMNLNREYCVDCGHDLKDVTAEQPLPPTTAAANPDKELQRLDALIADRAMGWRPAGFSPTTNHADAMLLLKAVLPKVQTGVTIRHTLNECEPWSVGSVQAATLELAIALWCKDRFSKE